MIDHYEAMFDSQYLRWFDLADKRETTVKITKVEPKELTVRGGAKKTAPVITMEGKKKQFVCNVTNADAIAELYGPKPSEWVGKSITLFVTTTKLSGKEVQCLRVRAPKNG